MRFPERSLSRCGATLALLLVVGCDSSAPPATDLLAGFDMGASRDEVVEALPPGGLVPTAEYGDEQLENGYLIDQYLIGGESVEILWIHDPGEGLPREAVRENLNPVVFRSGLLDGAGWEHFDQRAQEWGIPDRWAMTELAPAEDVRSF